MKTIKALITVSALTLITACEQSKAPDPSASYIKTLDASLRILSLEPIRESSDSGKLAVGHAMCNQFAQGRSLEEIVRTADSNSKPYMVAIGYSAAIDLCPEYNDRTPITDMETFLNQINP